MNRGDRVSFLNDYEYVSDALPGPGNYNPRVLIFQFRPRLIFGDIDYSNKNKRSKTQA